MISLLDELGKKDVQRKKRRGRKLVVNSEVNEILDLPAGGGPETVAEQAFPDVGMGYVVSKRWVI